MTSRKTYAIPLRGDSLPKLPSFGIRSERDLLALPGARVILQANAFPGRNPLVYTFRRTTTHAICTESNSHEEDDIAPNRSAAPYERSVVMRFGASEKSFPQQ